MDGLAPTYSAPALTPSLKFDMQPFRAHRVKEKRSQLLPHKGALCRVDEGNEPTYIIEIALRGEGLHELEYTTRDFDFAQRLFAILDAENRGAVDRSVVKEFVTLRCPVFWRRDDDLRRLRQSLDATLPADESVTFDEIWKAVALCSSTTQVHEDDEAELFSCEVGVEAWMVFCRFIALAQYLEAKRRFSARHRQETMGNNRSSSSSSSMRASDLVVVDVPPPEPPAPISAQQLAAYERKIKAPLPSPELDLDHSLLAAHDSLTRCKGKGCTNAGSVKINIFGPSFSSSLLSGHSGSTSTQNLEFAVTYMKGHNAEESSASTSPQAEEIVVRRSMADMKWLDDTFSSHKVLGGTLCGRILPPFPSRNRSSFASPFSRDESVLKTSMRSTTGAITAAAAGVSLLRDAAKTFFGSYLSNSGPQSSSSSPATLATIPPDETASTSSTTTGEHHLAKKMSKKKKSTSYRALPESYYNPNSPQGNARQLERYLNYLLEHPALSGSFPLNTILKVGRPRREQRTCL